MRKKILAGNWKMNKGLEAGLKLASEVSHMTSDELNSEIADLIIAPPFTHLYPIRKLIADSPIQLAAQNCHYEEKGAFTGEVSAAMLAEIGVSYVILGHSERRSFFQETNEIVAKKINTALSHKLRVVVCCGEDAIERKKNNHIGFVINQLQQSLFHLSSTEIKNSVIAYEPVWAIGTGLNATPDQAQEMHAAIRKVLASHYGNDTAMTTSILYGGSCNLSNAKAIFSCPDIDGGLIGGASLIAREFIDIAKVLAC